MRYKKSLSVIIMALFGVMTFTGVTFAADDVCEVVFIKNGQQSVVQHGKLAREHGTPIESAKQRLPQYFRNMGAQMSYSYNGLEIVTIDGKPWQQTQYADYIKEGFRQQPDSILNTNPELEKLVFDSKTNGKYTEIFKLADEGKSVDEIEDIVLKNNSSVEPKKPVEPTEPTKPEPVTNDGLGPTAILTVYIDSTEFSIRNGEQYQVGNLDAMPFIKNQTTMVPLRGIIDRFGAELEWNSIDRTVTVTNDKEKIVLTIDNANALVNGSMQQLTSPAMINSSRTFIPLRFVSEGLGLTVNWNAEDRSIAISR